MDIAIILTSFYWWLFCIFVIIRIFLYFIWMFVFNTKLIQFNTTSSTIYSNQLVNSFFTLSCLKIQLSPISLTMINGPKKKGQTTFWNLYKESNVIKVWPHKCVVVHRTRYPAKLAFSSLCTMEIVNPYIKWTNVQRIQKPNIIYFLNMHITIYQICLIFKRRLFILKGETNY